MSDVHYQQRILDSISKICGCLEKQSSLFFGAVGPYHFEDLRSEYVFYRGVHHAYGYGSGDGGVYCASWRPLVPLTHNTQQSGNIFVSYSWSVKYFMQNLKFNPKLKLYLLWHYNIESGSHLAFKLIQKSDYTKVFG